MKKPILYFKIKSSQTFNLNDKINRNFRFNFYATEHYTGDYSFFLSLLWKKEDYFSCFPKFYNFVPLNYFSPYAARS